MVKDETMIFSEEFCLKYGLGKPVAVPEPVTGGLMHKMYHVRTDKGEYAVKLLNPDIMKRPEAMLNMVNSELISNALAGVIPVVAAKSFDGKNIVEFNGGFYVVFDWLEGKSVFVPDISKHHCERIGRILGKIHAANIRVASVELSSDTHDAYNWKELTEKAMEVNSAVYPVLQENLADIMSWDNNVVQGLRELCNEQVISHRDLDPKNVLWKEDEPFVIDWEAAGYVNPYQELTEVLNYWIQDEAGDYDKEKFTALMTAYTESVDIGNVNWENVLNSSFDGMLGWLNYNLKRALKIEGTGITDQEEGISQSIDTVSNLKKYEERIAVLREWLS